MGVGGYVVDVVHRRGFVLVLDPFLALYRPLFRLDQVVVPQRALVVVVSVPDDGGEAAQDEHLGDVELGDARVVRRGGSVLPLELIRREHHRAHLERDARRFGAGATRGAPVRGRNLAHVLHRHLHRFTDAPHAEKLLRLVRPRLGLDPASLVAELRGADRGQRHPSLHPSLGVGDDDGIPRRRLDDDADEIFTDEGVRVGRRRHVIAPHAPPVRLRRLLRGPELGRACGDHGQGPVHASREAVTGESFGEVGAIPGNSHRAKEVVVLVGSLRDDVHVAVEQANLGEVLRLARERLGLGVRRSVRRVGRGGRRVPAGTRVVREMIPSRRFHRRRLDPREKHHARRVPRLRPVRHELHPQRGAVQHRLHDARHRPALHRREERVWIKRVGYDSHGRRQLCRIFGPHADGGGLRRGLGGDEVLVVGRLVPAPDAHLGPSVGDGFDGGVDVADVDLAKLSSDGLDRVLDAELDLLADEESAEELARREREGLVPAVPSGLGLSFGK